MLRKKIREMSAREGSEVSNSQEFAANSRKMIVAPFVAIFVWRVGDASYKVRTLTS